jgi:hypothetical protein
MLEGIEAELGNEKLEPAERSHLRHRAELIHTCLRHGTCAKRSLT